MEEEINTIVDDLQKNAMPFKTYVYEVKATHQIIRKHLESKQQELDTLKKEKDELQNLFNHSAKRHLEEKLKNTKLEDLKRKIEKLCYNENPDASTILKIILNFDKKNT